MNDIEMTNEQEDPTMTEDEFRETARAVLDDNASGFPREVAAFDVDAAWDAYVADPRPWHVWRNEPDDAVYPPPMAMFLSEGPWWQLPETNLG